MRYKITLSYNGSVFCGWQSQTNAPSVQDALEKALGVLLGGDVSVVGAGRTDAGVNARNYVAHFDCDAALGPGSAMEPGRFVCKLNAILPRQIAVHSIEAVGDGFHARFGAHLREYKYYIHNAKDPFDEAFSWQCGYPLDFERMQKACSYLVGRHDCSCFEKTGSDNTSSICEIYYARWEEQPADAPNVHKLVFTIGANRFLRNMVRAIVGTMIDIGRGRRSPEYILELLDHGTRSDAGQSVPGNALFLNKIEY